VCQELRVPRVACANRGPRQCVVDWHDATSDWQAVDELAAEGQTNRDIGHAPFVTTKTVEVPLSACYRKLGITSRIGLAQLTPPRQPGCHCGGSSALARLDRGRNGLPRKGK